MVARIKFAPELDFRLVTLNPAAFQYVRNEITRTESLGCKGYPRASTNEGIIRGHQTLCSERFPHH